MPDTSPKTRVGGDSAVDWDDAAVDAWESILRGNRTGASPQGHGMPGAASSTKAKAPSKGAAGVQSPRGERRFNSITGEQGGPFGQTSSPSREPKDGPSVHSMWQLYQEGQMSKRQFIDVLGGDLPASTLRCLDQVDTTFPHFVRSFGQAGVPYVVAPPHGASVDHDMKKKLQFSTLDHSRSMTGAATGSAGAKTRYKDSAGGIIGDNSAPAPAVRLVGDDANFRRASSDISRKAEREPTWKVRKANDASRNNPLFLSSSTAGVDEGADTNETESMLQSAVRMFLDGELQKRELSEYVCSLAKDGADTKVLTASVATLLERHEVNGPFTFRYIAQTLRGILAKAT
ncbi:unnamed protein product [Amoebophrya sp. A25]|nr:unnamed protein product [Amoebophrya sp. A25]|eukprot:GSA25T00009979001.1